MTINSESKLPRRKRLRYEGYDYSLDGAYFVTICARHQLCLFGDIAGEKVVLNDVGQMIDQWWQEIPSKYPSVELDLYVVMPNHFHGILFFAGVDSLVGPDADQPARIALDEAMKWFKTMTTNAYFRGVKQRRWQRVDGQLWQRSFHDRILRDEAELNVRRQYILSNPARWYEDEDYVGQRADT